MKLFEPGKIGKVVTRNRIIMAAMGVGGVGLSEPGGRLSQRGIDYYLARAKGGAGLIIIGGTRVSRDYEYDPDVPVNLRIDAGSFVALGPLNELAEAAHDYGARIAVQLTPGQGRCARAALARKIGAVGPSPLPCFYDPSIITRELTVEELQRQVQAFGFAAELVKSAGIDAIEINAHGGYLIDEFMTPLWNKRTDSYGGSLDNRLRFARELIDIIKKKAGADFPVMFRFGLEHHLEGGREIPEGLEIARKIEAAGADALNVDAGCYETMYWTVPPPTQPKGCLLDLAQKVKAVVRIPVISIGRLGDPEVAEQAIAGGKTDFIGLGRPLLADPEWPNKVKERRFDDIRPCIGCFKCMERLGQLKYMTCAVNPATGMEREFALKPAEKKKNVLVIGGGPAGMEAARVAALRGHKVALWEKGYALGGKMVPAAAPDFKGEYGKLTDYLARQICLLGVDVRLATAGTPEAVLAAKPDVVFVATGSDPIMPKIPGVDKPNVVCGTDVLAGKAKAGKSVAILGGGMVGCEIALHLLQQGKQVTIIEMLDKAMADVYMSARQHMLKLFADGGVSILAGTKALEIADAGVVVAGKDGKKGIIKADTVLLAIGTRPDASLFDSLRDRVPEVYFIGDCVEPRRIMNAIWEGFRTARII